MFQKRRVPRWGIRLGLAIGGMLIAVASVEAALWWMGYPLGLYPVGLFVQDATIGYHRPVAGFRGSVRTGETTYHVAINAAGLRGPALQPRRDVNWRLAGVGDSFTFGLGVNDEDTYLRQLEALLNASGKGRVEVLNAGVPGYGNAHELRYVERFVLPQDPDLVLLGFYAANDLSENGGPALQATRGVLVPNERVQFIDLKIWLRRHSRAYGLAADAMKRQRGLGHWLARWGLVRAADPGMNVNFPGTLYYLKAMPREVEDLWARAKELIEAMRQLLGERGIPLVVVSIPDRVSVYDEWMERAAQQGGVPVSALDGAQPDRSLERFCRERGIPFLSVLPALRDAAATGPALYFHYDGHWTPRGHRIVAERIAEFLRSHPELNRPSLLGSRLEAGGERP